MSLWHKLIRNLKYRHSFIRIIQILLMVVFSFQVLNEVTWKHIHRLPDGTIISHAHPYSKTSDSDPFKRHQHTRAEFLFYQHSETLFPFLLLLTLFFLSQIISEFISFPEYHADKIFVVPCKGRSPPV